MSRRIAVISMHTSPLAQPGTGYAGGMNVYVNELSQTMADRGVEVTLYTRRTAADQPPKVLIRPGYRVTHIEAGPAADLAPEILPEFVRAFADAVADDLRRGAPPDLIHSHYWLSGWAGALVKEQIALPLVNSFHTLGRVQDRSRREGEPPTTPIRALTEDEVLSATDAVVAATPHEVSDLVEHYGADPARLFVSPPGVDHLVFTPGDRATAREWLGLGHEPIVLFAGRIQAQKGIDIAIEAIKKLPERVEAGSGPPVLLVVGGPSGERGAAEAKYLNSLVASLNLQARVRFLGTRPHTEMADYYRAADVLVMPSRTETFGLVAAEAQACGLPVVASAVGGLNHVVADRGSGLVEQPDPAAFADALVLLLDDGELRARRRSQAVAHAEQFSWRSTANRLLDLYADVSAP